MRSPGSMPAAAAGVPSIAEITCGTPSSHRDLDADPAELAAGGRHQLAILALGHVVGMRVEPAQHALERAVDQLLGGHRHDVALLDLPHRALDQREVAGAERRVGGERAAAAGGQRDDEQSRRSRARLQHPSASRRSSGAVMLRDRAGCSRMRRGKGVERHARLENPGYGRIRRQVEPVALGVDHLRHQRDVGQAGLVAVAERAGPAVLGEQPLERAEALLDPMVVPGLDGGMVMPQRPLQIAQHAQIVDRMDVAGDDRRQPRTRARPAGSGGRMWRARSSVSTLSGCSASSAPRTSWWPR